MIKFYNHKKNLELYYINTMRGTFAGIEELNRKYSNKPSKSASPKPAFAQFVEAGLEPEAKSHSKTPKTASPEKAPQPAQKPESLRKSRSKLEKRLFDDIVSFLQSDPDNINIVPIDFWRSLRSDYKTADGYEFSNKEFMDIYNKVKKHLQPAKEKKARRPSGKALKKRPISVKQQRLEEMHYLHDSIEKLIQSDRETTINNPIGVGKVEKDFNDIFRLIELRIAGKKINVDLNKLFDKTYSKFSIYFKNSHVLKDFNYYFKPALLRLINQVGERKRQYVPKVNCKPDEFRNFTNRCVKYDSELAHRLYKLNNYWTNSKHPLYGKNKKEKEQFQNLVNKYSDPEFKKTVTHFFGTDEGKKYLKTIENKHKERHEQQQVQRKQKTTDTPCPKYIRHIASNRCVQLTSTLQKKFEETPNLRNNYKWGEQ